MKYPGVYMLGRGAHAEVISIAFAGKGQHQDAGAKAVHLAPNTTSRITSKSVSKDTGRTTYRGLLHVAKGATGVKSTVRCDALLLDKDSRTDTYPYVEVNEDDATISHEATVGKIGQDQNLLPNESWLHRIRCTLTYSWWIHGTIHKRAADGICSRTQPNGKNGNGRLSRLIVIVTNKQKQK